MTMHKERGLQDRLVRYGIAAAAVGGAGAAQAAVSVYDNGGAGWTVGVGDDFYFDIAGNISSTAGDFGLFNSFTLFGTNSKGTRSVYRDSWNRLENTRLSAGALIGPTMLAWTQLFSYDGAAYNGWSIPGQGYVGLQFDDGAGTVNYGWAEITLDAFGAGQTIELNAYAVEMTPDQAIEAGATSSIPEPSTLGLLALGAAGLAAHRRRKQA